MTIKQKTKEHLREFSRDCLSYDDVYHLMREGRYSDVISTLANEFGELRRKYRGNPNQSWYILGDAAYKIGDHYLALHCFKRSLRFDSKDGECMLAIGNCYEQMDRPDLAEGWFRRAVACAASNESKRSAIYNLGNALFDQKKYDQAIIHYKLLLDKKDKAGLLSKKNLKLFKI